MVHLVRKNRGHVTMAQQQSSDKRVVRFNCMLCPAVCGMLGTLDGGRLISVRGDRDNPNSQGYTCAKGRAIPELQYGPNRLDRPRIDGEDVTWDVLLSDLSGKLQGLIDAGGANQVGVFIGTGAAWDPIGNMAIRRLLTAIGSPQIYSPLMLDSAPALRAAELITGFPNFPAWTPEDAPTLAILAGTNPPISGGYVAAVGSAWSHRLRKFRRRGGELWVIDPRKTQSAHLADRHLAPRPGTDVFLFAWIVGRLLEEGADADELASACDPADVERLRAAVAPFTHELVTDRTGLAAGDLEDLLSAIRRHGKIAIVAGTGVTFPHFNIVTYWLMWATMILTGSLDREGGLRFVPLGRGEPAEPLTGHSPEDGSYSSGPASRPDLAGMLGERPGVALVDEIEAGEIRGLIIYGANPLTSAPDPDRLRAAMGKLEVLAVLDVFDNALTDMATHVIPCSWVVERNGMFGMPQYGVGRVYHSPPVVQMAQDRRHAWWVIGQLGRRLGADALGHGFDPDAVDDDMLARHFLRSQYDYADAVIEAGPHGLDIPSTYGWVHDKILPSGRWRLAPRILVDRLAQAVGYRSNGLRLINARRMDSVNATVYAGTEAPPPIHVSPDAAQERDITTGNLVRVSTAFGAVEGRALIDSSLGTQSVCLNHGWLDLNVNNLTDPSADRLTGQPILGAFPVELERV
jgi:anaerobic selenocysteine-containing dehydrogenase